MGGVERRDAGGERIRRIPQICERGVAELHEERIRFEADLFSGRLTPDLAGMLFAEIAPLRYAGADREGHTPKRSKAQSLCRWTAMRTHCRPPQHARCQRGIPR